MARWAIRTHAAVRIGEDGRPRDLLVVAREAPPHLLAEAAVDLLDDLEMAGQEPAEQLLRPRLERLGEDGVVRVAADRLRDLPGEVPLEALLVHEDAASARGW